MKSCCFFRLICFTILHHSCFAGKNSVPELKYESDFEIVLEQNSDMSTLVLDNRKDLKIHISCSGHRPTEIVLDLDVDVYGESAEDKLGQWSEHVLEGNTTIYTAFSHLDLGEKGLPRNETWYCRYVGSPEAVSLQFILSSDRNTVQAHQKIENNLPVDRFGSNKSSCTTHINFYQDVEADEVYFQCEGDGSSVFTKSNTFNCLTAQACASVYRQVQQKTCVTVQSQKNSSGEPWFNPTLIKPGVFVCWSKNQRAAVQYFFSGTGRGATRRTHLSWSEVVPKSLFLSLMLDKEEKYGQNTSYYLNDVITAHCGVPRYGFAYKPIIVAYLNGTLITKEIGLNQEERFERIWHMEAKVEVTAPGIYQIDCIAPIWNSTEYVVENRTVVVKGISSDDLKKSQVLTIYSSRGNVSQIPLYIGDTVDVECSFPGSRLGPNAQLIISANDTVILKNATDFAQDNSTERTGETDNTLLGLLSRVSASRSSKQSAGPLRKHETYTFDTSGRIGFECRIPLLEGSQWTEYKERQEITVKRSIPPRFLVSEEVVRVRIGESPVIICVADGDPEPVIAWNDKLYGPSMLVHGPNLTIINVQESDRGVYVCTAKNRFGKTARKNYRLEIETGPSAVLMIIISVSVCVFAVLICVIVYLVWRTIYHEERELLILKNKLLQGFSSGEVVADARKFLSLPFHAKKYIKRIATESFSIIGEGNFGIVFCSEIIESSGERLGVAVKGLRERDRTLQGMDTFVKEIKLMLYITDTLGGHANVVKFIGTDISKFLQKEIYLIMEHCEHGSLNNYLRKCTSRITSSSGLLHRWCFEISEGMDFLSRHNIIHIDLATRNVLLDSNNQAKISDFGLSRLLMLSDYYRDKGHVRFPARWTALELLDQDGRITTKSDIWSFGVTVWEIFSMGKEPNYEGAVTLSELRRKLEIGIRLEPPALADQETYDKMFSCWKEDPTERPTFTKLGSFFLAKWQNGSDVDIDLNADSPKSIVQGVNGLKPGMHSCSSGVDDHVLHFACGSYTYTSRTGGAARQTISGRLPGSRLAHNTDDEEKSLVLDTFM